MRLLLCKSLLDRIPFGWNLCLELKDLHIGSQLLEHIIIITYLNKR